MLTGIQSVIDKYNHIVDTDKYADTRTKDMFFIRNPMTTAFILIFYLYFCTRLGPKWMANRKPFEIGRLLTIYNALQVLLSLYIAIKGSLVLWTFGNVLHCFVTDLSDGPLNMRMINLCWWYCIAKVIELLDTVFFVLRKKNNHISFLHLYHHSLMVILTWAGTRYFVGGHGTIFGLVNSYVHVVMYTYYLIASLGPRYQKYLWWKRHVTEIQLAQFILVFIHNTLPLFNSSCEYSKTVHIIHLIFTLFFIYLFGVFYLKTYIYNKKKTEKLI